MNAFNRVEEIVRNCNTAYLDERYAWDTDPHQITAELLAEHRGEIRRADAAHLLAVRRSNISRAIFCDGIAHAAELLEQWAGEHPEAETAQQMADAHRTATLAEVTAWLIKKAREFHASSRKQVRVQGDLCAVLASQIARGAVRPNNVAMLPNAGFFEVDHTYTREHHGEPVTFRVEAISTSPDGQRTVAHGWRTDPYSGWDPFDSDDLTGWTDVTGAGDR